MKCILLAAGYATRLYPLTENFPKPLLEVGEKTILDWLIDDIYASGEIREFAVVTNHKFAKIFEDWTVSRMNSDRSGQLVTVIDDGTSTNETRLGAVRDIQFVLEKTGIDDVLVVAGDNLLDFSICSFIEYAKKKNTSCIMRYYEPDESRLTRSGVISIDDEGLVLSMEEKPKNPKSNWLAPPFYFYKAEDAARIADGIAAGCGVDAPGSYVAWLCSQTRVYSMQMPGVRFDIGNLDSYETAKKEYSGIIRGKQER